MEVVVVEKAGRCFVLHENTSRWIWRWDRNRHSGGVVSASRYASYTARSVRDSRAASHRISKAVPRSEQVRGQTEPVKSILTPTLGHFLLMLWAQ